MLIHRAYFLNDKSDFKSLSLSFSLRNRNIIDEISTLKYKKKEREKDQFLDLVAKLFGYFTCRTITVQMSNETAPSIINACPRMVIM